GGLAFGRLRRRRDGGPPTGGFFPEPRDDEPDGSDHGPTEHAEDGALPAAERPDRADELHVAEAHRLLAQDRLRDQRDPEHEPGANQHALDGRRPAADAVEEEKIALVTLQGG